MSVLTAIVCDRCGGRPFYPEAGRDRRPAHLIRSAAKQVGWRVAVETTRTYLLLNRSPGPYDYCPSCWQVIIENRKKVADAT